MSAVKLPTLPSASALDRAIACPASVAMGPQINSSSTAADRGTAIHLYLEQCALGIANPLAGVPSEYHEVCLAIDVDALFADFETDSAP